MLELKLIHVSKSGHGTQDIKPKVELEIYSLISQSPMS